MKLFRYNQGNFFQQRNSITDDERSWPAPPMSQTIVGNQRSLGKTSIIKATMTKDHIFLQHSSSTTPMTIIPGKRILMKVAFQF